MLLVADRDGVDVIVVTVLKSDINERASSVVLPGEVGSASGCAPMGPGPKGPGIKSAGLP